MARELESAGMGMACSMLDVASSRVDGRQQRAAAAAAAAAAARAMAAIGGGREG